jgi:YD repeat-containing protein
MCKYSSAADRLSNRRPFSRTGFVFAGCRSAGGWVGDACRHKPLGHFLILALLLSHSLLFAQTAPQITQLSPATGPAGTVTIIGGSNFGASQSGGAVSIGGVNAPVVAWSDTQITVTVPLSVPAGNASVTVTNGNGSTSNTSGFVVTPGAIFAGPVSYSYDELGRLVGVVAATGDSVQYTYDAVGNVLSITRTPGTQSSIFTFSPKSGPVGTQVTISGAGFSSNPAQDAVAFNGTGATVLAASPTQLVAAVPAGSTTGPITVTGPLGSATSASLFTVTSSSGTPRIDSFSPPAAMAGTAVTITGMNFDPAPPNDRLIVNLTPVGVPGAVSSTSMNMNVPSHAGSGHISLNTPAGLAVSTGDLFIPPPGYTVSQLAFTGRATLGTPTTVSIPSANGIGLLVFDGIAGQSVGIVPSAPTFNGCTLQVYAPDATALGPTGSCSSAGVVRVNLPATGTYTVGILPSGGSTGSVTLVLNTFTDVMGTISFGSPTTMSIQFPGQNARYTFSGAQGQQISVAISNSTYLGCTALWVSILKPDGSTLGWTGICGATGFIDSMTLPVAGTYTVLIAPAGANTGSVTVQLNTFADLSGTISIGTPLTVTTTGIGQNARYTFSGTQGQQISVNISDSTYPGCTALWVSILKPDGSTLGWTGICGATGFIDSMTLPSTGTYTVLVDPAGQNTGSVTILINTFSDLSGTTSIGTPLTVTTTVAGQNARYTFSGTQGQQISVTISNSTYPSCTALWVSILKPDGSTLGWTGICGATGFIDSMTLPSTGTYTVLIDPAGQNTGSVTVLINTFADLSGTISIGTPLTVTTTGIGQNARYTFSGTQGQQISVNISNSTYPGCTALWVSILKPDGSTLGWTGICGATGFIDSMTLPSTGTYTVLIDPAGQNTGSVTVLINTFTDLSGTISIGTPLMVTTAVAGQNARYTFSGTQGQQISLTITNSTYAGCTALWVSVLNPDGSTLGWTGVCGSSGLINSVTLPVTGTYTVLVDPAGPNTGSAIMLLSQFGDLSGSITFGTPVTVTTTVTGQKARLVFNSNAGQQISLSISGSTYPGCLALSVSVLKPDGTTLGSTGICGPTGFIDSMTTPLSGAYTVLIAPAGTGTGNVTLQLNTFADLSGTISIGAPLTVTTTGIGQNARYTFSGTQGQQISVSISNSTYPGCLALGVSILKPDGSTLGSTGICGATGFIDSMTLPSTGTYTVLVDPAGQNTGSVTILINTFTDISGTISIGTPLTVTTTGIGQNARYTFSGTQGEQISLTVSNSTYPGCLALSVSVLNPDGSTLGSTGICGSSGLISSMTLPLNGTYTVLVDPAGSNTGSATVLLTQFGDLSGSITFGTPVTVTTTVTGQKARLVFNGNAGQQFSLSISNSTYPGCIALSVSILKPDGTTLGSTGICGATGFIDSMTMPVSGAYTVLIAPGGTGTGSVTLQLNTFADITGTTSIGTPLTVTTTGIGQNAFYTFSGTQGQQISVTISNSTYPGCIALSLSILKPDGSRLGSAGICGATGFIDSMTMPSTGTYTLVVDPGGQNTGSVTILINTFADITGTTSIGTPLTVTTTGIGQNAFYTFSGTQGQQISVTISNSTYPGCISLSISILNPDGSRLGSTGICGATGFIDSMTMPATGTYTLLVDPGGENTGSVTILINTFADITGTISIGTPLTVTTTGIGQNARYTFSGTQGQQASVSLSNSTYSGCISLSVSILNPDGSRLGSTGICGATGSINPAALPTSGTYTILIDPGGTNTGSVTVALALN